jgi:hypothetical protein
MLSTENATAKSLAPVITSGRALNSVSIQLMKSGRLISAGSGAGRTPKFFKDFSYSLNRRCNLLMMSEMSFPEASLYSASALSRS